MTTSGSDDRGPLLRVLARQVLDNVGSRLNTYAGYEDDVVMTIALLDQAGLLGRDDLREAFEEAGENHEHADAMAALLAAYLGHAADIERLGVDTRLEALRLATAWQQHVSEHAPAKPEWLTAAQVAARYGVTPQAVYKWIRAGRVQAEQAPGGSWRLPVSQFERGSRVDPERIAALKSKLLSIDGVLIDGFNDGREHPRADGHGAQTQPAAADAWSAAPPPRRGEIVARADGQSRLGLRPALRAPLTGLP